MILNGWTCYSVKFFQKQSVSSLIHLPFFFYITNNHHVKYGAMSGWMLHNSQEAHRWVDRRRWRQTVAVHYVQCHHALDISECSTISQIKKSISEKSKKEKFCDFNSFKNGRALASYHLVCHRQRSIHVD